MTAKLTQSVKLRRASSSLLQQLVRADDVDDPADTEQAGESDGARGTEPSAYQRDQFVEDVICREEPWSLPDTPALDTARFPVVSVGRVLQGVEGGRIDKDSGERLSAAPDRDGGHGSRRRAYAPSGRADDRPGRRDRRANPGR